MLPGSFRRSGTVRRVRRALMTTDAAGGVWRYALDLSRALAVRGVEVTLAQMGPAASAAQRQEAQLAGIPVIESSFALEWMDSPWDEVDRAGHWLLGLERALRPDVVHVNGFSHAALPWDAPVVLVAHSCVCSWWRAVHGVSAPSSWHEYRRRVRDGLQAARVVVAPTAAMLAALRYEHGDLPEARVIPNGRLFDGGWPSEPTQKADFVFAAGRLWDEGKNMAALCEAAPALAWPVVIAGDAAIGNGGATARREVIHVGRLDTRSLGDWLARAAIYALPARYEPFGLSVLEAARAGCALVLGDIPSLRENWSGAADFVPPHDARALAAAISRLVEDPAHRGERAAAARRRAAGFSIDATADAYVRTYAEVCGTPRAAAARSSRVGVAPAARA